LYYGALKKTPYKWLNLDLMCRKLLPRNSVESIKYFTARVSARPHDQDQPIRQQTYLRALATLPNIHIIYGHFLTHEISMPVAGCSPHKQQYVKVIKTEEKGSDVNLAAHLVNDGHKGLYEAAVLITNDSDLQEPVRIVRHELGLVVGIINPYQRASRALVQHASFVKTIRKGLLAATQFPDTLHDAHGTFTKPKGW
jgi:uncharacterized LabA/DUF88 family protein